jgi:hypothetical protein
LLPIRPGLIHPGECVPNAGHSRAVGHWMERHRRCPRFGRGEWLGPSSASFGIYVDWRLDRDVDDAVVAVVDAAWRRSDESFCSTPHPRSSRGAALADAATLHRGDERHRRRRARPINDAKFPRQTSRGLQDGRQPRDRPGHPSPRWPTELESTPASCGRHRRPRARPRPATTVSHGQAEPAHLTATVFAFQHRFALHRSCGAMS